MNRDVETALNAVKEAQISLQVECRKAYPLGTQVHVKLGAAKVVLAVVGHSHAYWSDPGVIYGMNIKTGKRREFHDSQVLEVIFKPGPVVREYKLGDTFTMRGELQTIDCVYTDVEGVQRYDFHSASGSDGNWSAADIADYLAITAKRV